MKVNALELKENLIRCLKTTLVPMIHSSPGIGKSDIVRQIGKRFNLKVIDIRLSQYDPTELGGFPMLAGNKAKHVPMEIFPIKSDSVPKGYDGWILFLDEFNSASMATMAAAYKLVLDRYVGEYKLHPRCKTICAGNLVTDGAIVNRTSTAMQSRLIHFELEPDIKSWIHWAVKNNIDQRIMAYLQYKPNNLYNFNPHHNDFTFASPRTWFFTSELIKHDKDLMPLLSLISGTVSEAVAREFIAYTQIYTDLPSIKEIEAAPGIIPINTEPSILYAISTMLSAYITAKNIDIFIEYIKRLPIEFAVITLQNAITKHPDIIEIQSVIDWTMEVSVDLF